MWSNIYLLRASGCLDRNSNLNPNPNPNPNPKPNRNPKEGTREIFQIEFVFESYFEVDKDVWVERRCIGEECESFVLDNVFLVGW